MFGLRVLVGRDELDQDLVVFGWGASGLDSSSQGLCLRYLQNGEIVSTQMNTVLRWRAQAQGLLDAAFSIAEAGELRRGLLCNTKIPNFFLKHCFDDLLHVVCRSN